MYILSMTKRKPIPDFSGYEIDIDGNIFSFQRYPEGKQMKTSAGNHGYPVVALKKGNKMHWKLVHRLVLETFVGNCPKTMEARHLDGVRTNCKLSNLAWGTHEENDKDKVIHGKMKKSLSECEVIDIRTKYCTGEYTQKYLSNIFNVGQDQISRIVNYKRWVLTK